MAVYVGIFALLALTGASQRPGHHALGALYIWIAFLVVFAGTREYTGCDFHGYLNRFNQYNAQSLSDALFRSEALFSLLTYGIVKLDLDFMWLNVIATVIIFIGFGAFARRCENPVSFLALAFPILIVQLAMSGIRQAMAVAMVLIALNAFRDGRRLATAIFILIASQFHTSAIVFLPIALIAGKEVSIRTLVGATLLVAPVAFYFSSERAETYQTRYLENDVDSFGAIFRVALLLITAVFFELYRKRYRLLYPYDYPLMRLFSIFSFGVAASFVVSTLVAHRLGYYVMPVHILMLLRLPTVLQQGRRDPLLPLMPFVAYGAYILVWFSISSHADKCYIPYDSYLF